jgi:site-specific DNA recombinase
MGHTAVMRWNDTRKWIISKTLAHQPIIDDDTFQRAQAVFGSRRRRAGIQHKTRHTRKPYVLRNLIHCAVCQRRMQGQHNHGAAYYRCRYPQEYALANIIEHPANVYLREDAVVEPLDAWLHPPSYQRIWNTPSPPCAMPSHNRMPSSPWPAGDE